MFPFALYHTFGKKGAMIGLIGGFIILVYAEMLSLMYAMILVPIAFIISVLMFKEKRSE